MLASGVFVLADVRNNGGFSARTVGVYVGKDGGVIDFLEEEDVEVVLEVSEATKMLNLVGWYSGRGELFV